MKNIKSPDLVEKAKQVISPTSNLQQPKENFGSDFKQRVQEQIKPQAPQWQPQQQNPIYQGQQQQQQQRPQVKPTPVVQNTNVVPKAMPIRQMPQNVADAQTPFYKNIAKMKVSGAKNLSDVMGYGIFLKKKDK